jgi:hypothetical protein
MVVEAEGNVHGKVSLAAGIITESLVPAAQKRGMKLPVLAVGDGALGFCAAVRDVFPETRRRRDWVHKSSNGLDALPKSVHSRAKSAIKEITCAENKAEATKSVEAFAAEFGAKWPKAVQYDLALPNSQLEGSYLPALEWSAGSKLRFVFGLSDLNRARYAEAWLPVNLVFDQHSISLEVQIINTTAAHSVITNGVVTNQGLKPLANQLPRALLLSLTSTRSEGGRYSGSANGHRAAAGVREDCHDRSVEANLKHGVPGGADKQHQDVAR